MPWGEEQGLSDLCGVPWGEQVGEREAGELGPVLPPGSSFGEGEKVRRGTVSGRPPGRQEPASGSHRNRKST